MNELVERISNITGDKYEYEKRDYSLPHIEDRINENENKNGKEEIVKDKNEL